jgi:hypothetical protein
MTDIRPNGLDQKDLVDMFYMVVSSIAGICAKLDSDTGVPLTTYTANCYTAMFDMKITDSNGQVTGPGGGIIIFPGGITSEAKIELLYQIYNAIETLTEQLDTDVLTDSNYEALCYTALLLHRIQNKLGNFIGNGTTYKIGPTGEPDQREMVDCLYGIVDAIETLTEKLDADGTVTDTDYEALWYTANITIKIRNSSNETLGN